MSKVNGGQEAARRASELFSVDKDLRFRPGGPSAFLAAGPSSLRRWLHIDDQGRPSMLDVDKHRLVQDLNIRYRDLLTLDPSVPIPYPASFFIREKAMVVNLEAVRLIICANQCYLLSVPKASCTRLATAPDPSNPFVQQLCGVLRVAAESRKEMMESSFDYYAGMPYELRALEWALATATQLLDEEIAELEGEAYPAIDKMVVTVSREVLEDVRAAKTTTNRLIGRVQRIKQELEEVLEDDADMQDMYLRRRAALEGKELPPQPPPPSAAPSSRLARPSPYRWLSNFQGYLQNGGDEGVSDTPTHPLSDVIYRTSPHVEGTAAHGAAERGPSLEVLPSLTPVGSAKGGACDAASDEPPEEGGGQSGGEGPPQAPSHHPALLSEERRGGRGAGRPPHPATAAPGGVDVGGSGQPGEGGWGVGGGEAPERGQSPQRQRGGAKRAQQPEGSRGGGARHKGEGAVRTEAGLKRGSVIIRTIRRHLGRRKSKASQQAQHAKQQPPQQRGRPRSRQPGRESAEDPPPHLHGGGGASRHSSAHSSREDSSAQRGGGVRQREGDRAREGNGSEGVGWDEGEGSGSEDDSYIEETVYEHPGMGGALVDPHDIEEAEDLLEAYFMQVDFLLRRLMLLKERTDDTEDLVNIEMDHRRNELVALDLLVTCVSASFAFVAMVAGIFGMNLYNSELQESKGAFVAIMVVTGVVGVGLLALILLHIRRRGLMFIPTI